MLALNSLIHLGHTVIDFAPINVPIASMWSVLGDGLFSSQGIMVMLLAAYGGAMWMFLTSAPKVYTIMVSDLAVAKDFYEGMLNLTAADIPLHYYYNYEQSMGAASFDPMMLSGRPDSLTTRVGGNDGLWYQLRKNVQIHVIAGASFGEKSRERHISFDHDCLEQVLLRVQNRGLKYKIEQERPLGFLVKDYDGRVLELCEMKN
jgi:catechol 2,3-dioxygenase-like lactoylglutathione lyase family enzyme